MGPDGLIYPYLDAIGLPTQGWGIRVASMKVPPITQRVADTRLTAKVGEFERGVVMFWPNYVKAPVEVQAAVLSWCYNCGLGNFRASTFRRRLMDEDWCGAAEECRKWDKAGGKKLRGLTIRRNTEAAMIEGVVKCHTDN